MFLGFSAAVFHYRGWLVPTSQVKGYVQGGRLETLLGSLIGLALLQAVDLGLHEDVVGGSSALLLGGYREKLVDQSDGWMIPLSFLVLGLLGDLGDLVTLGAIVWWVRTSLVQGPTNEPEPFIGATDFAPILPRAHYSPLTAIFCRSAARAPAKWNIHSLFILNHLRITSQGGRSSWPRHRRRLVQAGSGLWLHSWWGPLQPIAM